MAGARHDVAGMQAGPPPQSVTTPPASRTSDAPAATSQGPRASSKKPSNTPQATQARSRHAAPGAPQVLEMPERGAAWPRGSRGSRSLWRKGNPVATTACSGPPVTRPHGLRSRRRGAPSSRPARRPRASSAQERRRDRAGDRTPVLHQRDRHPDRREAVDEVGRAVQRVDDPAAPRRSAAALLAVERDLGRRLAQERLDRGCSRQDRPR